MPAGLGPEPDLTARALAALREAGMRWPDGSGVRIEVEKSIPVAAGLGGGSADAAAVLRLAAGELPDEPARGDRALARAPTSPRSSIPGFCLVGGAGEDDRVDLPLRRCRSRSS